MELFRRFPGGWIEAPPDLPTDYFMWRRILEQIDVRAASGHRPTVLVFPTPLRQGWSFERRRAELAPWSERIGDPGFSSEVEAWAFSAMCQSWFEQYREAERRLETLERVHRAAADLRRQLDEKERSLSASKLRWWQRRARSSSQTG
jgi:hypothetical protein